MIKRMLLPGFIEITAIGAYVEEWLTTLIKSGLKVYSVRNVKGIFHIIVRRSDYRIIARNARKYMVRVKVIKKNKIIFINTTFKKAFGILSGSVAAFMFIIILQNYIWKINIYGNDIITNKQILELVADYGIFIGAETRKINVNTAEYNAKLNLKEISWINVEINGSKVDIYINESELLEKNDLPNNKPCNVIASRDGVITEAKVYAGTLVYPVGSGVTEGNVIISGVVNDGADNLIITHANGEIIADFTETIELRQDFNTIEKNETGTKEKYQELMIMGLVIPITSEVPDTDNKICDEYIEKYKLFGLPTPLYIKTNEYTTIKETEVNRTIDDVNRLLTQKLELYCQNFYSEYKILDISKNFYYDENGITLKADIKLNGNIAVKQEIKR